MALYLEPLDLSEDLEKLKSVLIVSCPVCPAVSLAMQKQAPLIEFFKHGIKTSALEDYVQSIREPLERRGIRTGVFTSRAPFPTMCLWTKGQRDRLRKHAAGYDAALVLGCNTALYTSEETLRETGCLSLLAMETTGETNAVAKFRLPLTVTLENRTRIDEGNKAEKLA